MMCVHVTKPNLPLYQAYSGTDQSCVQVFELSFLERLVDTATDRNWDHSACQEATGLHLIGFSWHKHEVHCIEILPGSEQL